MTYLARVAGWDSNSLHHLQYSSTCLPGLDLYHDTDPAKPLTTTGRELDDLYVDDDLPVDDLLIDDLSEVCNYFADKKLSPLSKTARVR